MRFLLVVPAVALSWLVAQTTPTANFDLGTALVAYGVAAPFAGICVWGWLRAERRAQKAEEELRAAVLARLDRERQITETLTAMAPMLRNVAQTLPEAIANVDAVTRRQADPLDSAVERLERLYDRLRDERPHG